VQALIARIEVTVMASILTTRGCHQPDRGGLHVHRRARAVGIRLRPAAAIVRQYGERFRRPARRNQMRRPKPPLLL
jgi:hypothetical protein